MSLRSSPAVRDVSRVPPWSALGFLAGVTFVTPFVLVACGFFIHRQTDWTIALVAALAVLAVTLFRGARRVSALLWPFVIAFATADGLARLAREQFIENWFNVPGKFSLARLEGGPFAIRMEPPVEGFDTLAFMSQPYVALVADCGKKKVAAATHVTSRPWRIIEGAVCISSFLAEIEADLCFEIDRNTGRVHKAGEPQSAVGRAVLLSAGRTQGDFFCP